MIRYQTDLKVKKTKKLASIIIAIIPRIKNLNDLRKTDIMEALFLLLWDLNYDNYEIAATAVKNLASLGKDVAQYLLKKNILGPLLTNLETRDESAKKVCMEAIYTIAKQSPKTRKRVAKSGGFEAIAICLLGVEPLTKISAAQTLAIMGEDEYMSNYDVEQSIMNALSLSLGDPSIHVKGHCIMALHTLTLQRITTVEQMGFSGVLGKVMKYTAHKDETLKVISFTVVSNVYMRASYMFLRFGLMGSLARETLTFLEDKSLILKKMSLILIHYVVRQDTMILDTLVLLGLIPKLGNLMSDETFPEYLWGLALSCICHIIQRYPKKVDNFLALKLKKHLIYYLLAVEEPGAILAILDLMKTMSENFVLDYEPQYILQMGFFVKLIRVYTAPTLEKENKKLVHKSLKYFVAKCNDFQQLMVYFANVSFRLLGCCLKGIYKVLSPNPEYQLIFKLIGGPLKLAHMHEFLEREKERRYLKLIISALYPELKNRIQCDYYGQLYNCIEDLNIQAEQKCNWKNECRAVRKRREPEYVYTWPLRMRVRKDMFNHNVPSKIYPPECLPKLCFALRLAIHLPDPDDCICSPMVEDRCHGCAVCDEIGFCYPL